MKSNVGFERRFQVAVRVLIVLILGLMALGAGVRTMKAGLSCPDWPLCFGQVIPDFHPGVYFEFIHRAYAGLVALAYLAFCIYVIRSKALSAVAKRLAGFGLFVLLLQIVMGGLTVLKLVKEIIVTSHLMLATTFLCVVLWIGFVAVPGVSRRRVLRKLESPNAGKAEATAAPAWVKWMATAVAVAVFGQIFLGGLVASTYAGSVCVDWPLCNGQWFPTWQGAIGLQIMHRMMAYGLALVIPLVACLFHCLHRFRRQTWMTDQLLHLSYLNVAVVLMQVALGVANLLLYIPPHVTVLHQSVGLILLIVNLRVVFVTWALARSRQATLERNQEAGVSGWRSGAAL